MASYKYGQYLVQNDHAAFDTELGPGSKCPNSGVWRCAACGDEIAANKGDPLPPQNHHQHGPGKGAIRWKLLIFAVQQ